MSRLYVSLRLKNNYPVIQCGCSCSEEMEYYYNNLLSLLEVKKQSPCSNFKIKDYQEATLKYCVRKNKKVRKIKIINVKETSNE